MSRPVAIVTGAARGIGRATAEASRERRMGAGPQRAFARGTERRLPVKL